MNTTSRCLKSIVTRHGYRGWEHGWWLVKNGAMLEHQVDQKKQHTHTKTNNRNLDEDEKQRANEDARENHLIGQAMSRCGRKRERSETGGRRRNQLMNRILMNAKDFSTTTCVRQNTRTTTTKKTQQSETEVRRVHCVGENQLPRATSCQHPTFQRMKSCVQTRGISFPTKKK